MTLRLPAASHPAIILTAADRLTSPPPADTVKTCSPPGRFQPHGAIRSRAVSGDRSNETPLHIGLHNDPGQQQRPDLIVEVARR
jgi:hypothetical protein